MSEDRDLQLAETINCRLLLQERDPPINEVVESGLVHRFVLFTSTNDFPELKHESAFVLATITKGTSNHIAVLIDSGAVPLFVQLVTSDREEVQLVGVRALGNIAAGSTERRDHVLNSGAMMSLTALFNEHATSSSVTLLTTASITIFHLCSRDPPPALEHKNQALPLVKRLLLLFTPWDPTNHLLLQSASLTLSRLSNDGNIQNVIDLIPRLIHFLGQPNLASIVLPTLDTINNILEDTTHIQAVIDNQALPSLLNVLTSTDNKRVKLKTCFTIVCVLSGNTSQVQQVIEAGIMQRLIHLLRDTSNIRTTALIVLATAIHSGSHDQIKFLVAQGCIEPLCDFIISDDISTVVLTTLGALEGILIVGEAEKNLGNTGDVNLYAAMIVDAGILDKIAELRSHGNPDIREMANRLTDDYL
ncbi:unnamed protein product [Microthlaspi erraticum]|uniref:Armadillo repeat-containing domain-containing protein n=1 Tax=Microthlaspi erraticum TaxID=1685480 RepID=A0A6D2IMI4_9BRAS|nr:unnamed protein product [Microthlaspi erraticum]